jgi:hypothetical protein
LNGGEPRSIAEDATYFRFSPDSARLGYVARGDLHLVELETGADRLLVPQTSTFSFASNGKRLLARRPSAAGGTLFLCDLAGGAPRKLGDNVGEYEFSPDGASVGFTARSGGPAEPYALFLSRADEIVPRKVGDGVSAFLFSPDSRFVAYIDGLTPTKMLGSLEVASVSGGPSRKLGEDVVEQRFSPSSSGIAFRESHEDKAGRKWMTFKVAALPGGDVKVLGENVPNFLWSFEGGELAFLKRVLKPDYSVNLMVYRLGTEAPRQVDRGVFGYQYAPGDRALWYRTRCIRNGRECDLMSVKVSGDEAPVRVVQGIWSFRPNRTGERLLLTYPRLDTEAAADLGILDVGANKPSRGIDVHTLPGATFADDAGTRVVYIVSQRNREGVYVADVP